MLAARLIVGTVMGGEWHQVASEADRRWASRGASGDRRTGVVGRCEVGLGAASGRELSG
jgi:hypothetical protein